MAEDERDRGDGKAGSDSGGQHGEPASGDGGGGCCAGYHQAEEEGRQALDGHCPPQLQAAYLDGHGCLPVDHVAGIVLTQGRQPGEDGDDVRVHFARQ